MHPHLNSGLRPVGVVVGHQDQAVLVQNDGAQRTTDADQ